MVISVLGGYIKAYNDDELTKKRVEASSLATGQKGVLDAEQARIKRKYEQDEFDRRERVKAGNRPKDNFKVTFKDNTNIIFPVYNKLGSNTGKDVVAIDNALHGLDTEDKKAEFIRVAQSEGDYGSDVLNLLESYRYSKTNKWGPNNENDPITPNFNVNSEHPFYGYFNKVKVKIAGVNEGQLADKNAKTFIIPDPIIGDDADAAPVYSIFMAGGDTLREGAEYLISHQQVMAPNTNLKDVFNINTGEHVYETEAGTYKDLIRASVADLFNRDTATKDGVSYIERDWNNLFATPPIQDGLTANNQVIPGQGLELEVYVLGKDGKAKIEKRRVAQGWRINEWLKNVYPAMNVAKFRQGGFQFLKPGEWNADPSSPYGDLFSIAEASDVSEQQIFLALDIFSKAGRSGLDPMSSVGNMFKWMQDAFLAKNSQVKQLFRGFNLIVDGTLDQSWNTMTPEKKEEIRKANTGISEYMSMDTSMRDKTFSDLTKQNVLLEQIFTLLAYNVALTTQGGTSLSARVSNEDYDNARNAVVGGGFDSLENRMLGLMQYYQLTAPKSMSFYLLNNEEGWGITGKKGKLQNEIIPIILSMDAVPDIMPLGDYSDPYAMFNYLAIRPYADEKRRVWANAIKYAYRDNLERVFDPDYDPNAATSSSTSGP